jgi:hypothetical protein
MAAFCTCCGAEITLKAEACLVCGAPRHGMVGPVSLLTLNIDTILPQEEIEIDSGRNTLSVHRQDKLGY